MRRTLILAAILVGATSLWALLSAQGGGGAFVPNFPYNISCGCWNFSTGFLVGTNTAAQTFGALNEASVTLTNAQVLALNQDSGAIQVVAAPGNGYWIDPISWSETFNETGAYTSGTDIALYWGTRGAGTRATVAITTSGFLTASATAIARASGLVDNTPNPPTTNQALYVEQINTTAFGGGNAANTLVVKVVYRILRTGL